MSNFIPSVIQNFGDVTTVNANFQGEATSRQTKLDRYGGTGNQMNADLDMNGFSILNQANPIVIDGLNFVGPWVTATSFSVGDCVTYPNSTYYCAIGHTSGTFYDDVENGYWVIIALGFCDKGTWVTNTKYLQGDTLPENQGYYLCKIDHVSGSFNADVTAGKWVLMMSEVDGFVGQLMWSETALDPIPTGWYLCDGTNGTEDYRNRFPVMVGPAFPELSVGGSADAIVVDHTHTATSVVTDPGHIHTYTTGTSPIGGASGSDLRNNWISQNTGSSVTGITVATTIDSAGSSGVNANLPPWFSAYLYIYKGV